MSAGGGAPPNARRALVAAVAARLATTVAGAAVFDAPPVRAGLPYAVIDEPVLADASASGGWIGREGRLAVTLHDAGERPERLRGLIAAVEDALPRLGGAIGDGWLLAQIRLVRSRLVRVGGGDRWAATAEFAVRLWRQQA